MPQDPVDAILNKWAGPAPASAPADPVDALLQKYGGVSAPAINPAQDYGGAGTVQSPEDATRARLDYLFGPAAAQRRADFGRAANAPIPREQMTPEQQYAADHPYRSAIASGLYDAGQMMSLGLGKYVAAEMNRMLDLPGPMRADDVEQQMANANVGVREGGLGPRVVQGTLGATGLLLPGSVAKELIPEGAGLVRTLVTQGGVFGGERAVQGVVEGEPVADALKEGAKTGAVAAALPLVGRAVAAPLERALGEKAAEIVGTSAAFGAYGAATAEPGDRGVRAASDATVGAILGAFGVGGARLRGGRGSTIETRPAEDPSFRAFLDGKRRVYLDPDASKSPTATELEQRARAPSADELAKQGVQVVETSVGKVYYRPETLQQFAADNGITETVPDKIIEQAKAKNILGRLLDYGAGNDAITEDSQLVTGRDADGREIATISAKNPESAKKALIEQHGATTVDEPRPFTELPAVLRERAVAGQGGGSKPPTPGGEFEGDVGEGPKRKGTAAAALHEAATESAKNRRVRFGQEIFSPQYSRLRKPAPEMFERATQAGAVLNAADTTGDLFTMDMRKVLSPAEEHAWVRYQQDANARAMELQGRTPKLWLKMSDAEKFALNPLQTPEILARGNAEYDRQMGLVEPYAPSSEYLPPGARRPIEKLNDPLARYLRFSRVFTEQTGRAKDLAEIAEKEGRETVLAAPEFEGETQAPRGTGGGPISKRGLFRRAGSAKRASGTGEAYSLHYGDIIKDTLRDRLYSVTHNRLRDAIRAEAEKYDSAFNQAIRRQILSLGGSVPDEYARPHYVVFDGKKEPLVAVDLGEDPKWRRTGELATGDEPTGTDPALKSGENPRALTDKGTALSEPERAARDSLWQRFRGAFDRPKLGTGEGASETSEGSRAAGGGAPRQSEIVYVPKSIASAWERHIVPPGTWKLFFPLDKVANALVRIQLITGAEATMHATNVLGGLATNPGIAETKVGTTISTALAGRIVPAIKRAYSLDPDSPEFEHDLISGIMNGAIRGSQFKEYGGFEDKIPGFGTLKKAVFGPTGTEVRSRITMFRLLKEFDPTMTDADAWNRVNNELGTYVAQLAPFAANVLSGTGIDPFARAGIALGKTALKTAVGIGPNGKFSPERAAIIPSAIMAWAIAHKAMDEKHRWPWDAGSSLGELPIGDSKVQTLSILMNPVTRAARLLGLAGGEDALMRGGDSTGDVLAGAARGALNAISGRLGPLPRAAWVGLTSLAGQGRGSLPILGSPPVGVADPEHPVLQSVKNVLQTAVPQYGDLMRTVEQPELAAEAPGTKTVRYILDFFGLSSRPARDDNARRASNQKAHEAVGYQAIDDIMYETRALPMHERIGAAQALLRQRIAKEDQPFFMRALIERLRGAPKSNARALNRAKRQGR